MLLDISLLPMGMLVLALGCLGWDLLLPAGLPRPRFLRAARARPRRAAAPGGLEEAQLSVLHGKVRELEATAARLRQVGHAAVAERDAARAEAASLRLALGAAKQELAQIRHQEELESLAKAVLHDVADPLAFAASSQPATPALAEATEQAQADAGKFRAARLAFARLYHPDRGGASEIDRLVRGQVFKEFWTELERIERSSA